MFGLDFKEIFVLAILMIPLALLVAGVICLFVYIMGLLVKDMFGHMHFRHRKAH